MTNPKPMSHQTVSIKHNDHSPIVLDCSDAGTGKTFVRILGFAKRRARGSGCLLVLAPRSLLRSVWVDDFRKFAPHLTVSVANAANREGAFDEVADVYVTNVDAVKWLAKQKPAFFKRFSELVVDESTALKHHTSQRSKAAAKIAKYFKHRCCMTATPSSNTITDIWHQVLLLDGGERLGSSFYRFREAVCTPVQQGRQAQMVRWEDKEGAEEVVFGLLSDIVIRHRLDDCADIPPNHQYPMSYELTVRQLTAYWQMEATQLLMLKDMKGPILAVHAASATTKLLQIASGAVYDNEGGYQVVDTARYEMVLDLVEQRAHSLVIFLWQHQRDGLIAEATKRGVTYRVIDGNTSDRDRAEIVQGYQAGLYQTIFGHPKTVAHGFTLTRGTATIWTSPTYDLEHAIQGSSRQRRIGQTQKTETIIIVAKGTIEEKVYDTVMAKGQRMGNLLSLFDTVAAAPAKKTTKKVKEVA